MQSPSPSPEGSLKRCNESICSLLCPAQGGHRKDPRLSKLSVPLEKLILTGGLEASAQVQLRFGQIWVYQKYYIISAHLSWLTVSLS